MPDEFDFGDWGDRPRKAKFEPRIRTPEEQELIERVCEYQAKEARRADRLAMVILSPAIVGCVFVSGYIAREILRDIYKHFKGSSDNEYDKNKR